MTQGRFQSDVIWQIAQSWVKSNNALVWCVTAPYYRKMFCNYNDLISEAQIIAYQVIFSLINQNQELSSINRYFRVVFRARCIELAAGVSAVPIDIIPEVAAMEKEQAVDLDESIIAEALAPLTNRQRQISHWILKQPRPVSLADIAKQFGIHQQNAGRLLSASIHRIKNKMLLETA